MSSLADRPLFDIGLQLERTALSWRRTSLSLTVMSLIAARLATAEVNALTLVFAFLGVAIAAALFIGSHQRYRRNHRRLVEAQGRVAALGGAALLAITAAFVLVLALGGLAFVFLRASSS